MKKMFIENEEFRKKFVVAGVILGVCTAVSAVVAAVVAKCRTENAFYDAFVKTDNFFEDEELEDKNA